MKLGDATVLSVADARSLAKRRLGEVAAGVDPLAQKRAVREARNAELVTFKMVAQAYIDEHARLKRKASTADEYQRKLDTDIPAKMKRMPIGEIERDMVADLHHSRRTKPVAANRILAFASAVLSHAEKKGLRPQHTNVAMLVEKFPEKSREQYLSETELQALGKGLDELQEKDPRTTTACDAIRLLALTGARRNEVLDLRWEYIDAERQIAWLPDSRTGKRPLLLGPEGMALLESRNKTNVWCFPSYRSPGTPVRDVRKTLARATELAKLKPFRLHDLRHSFASVAVGAGHSLPVVGALLGHVRASTTERYAHLQKNHVTEAHADVQGRIGEALRRGR
jgi:integrase